MSSGDQGYEALMRVSIEEARASLREGNKGFGAVLVRGGRILAKAHDSAATDSDPTAHAEMNLVRQASRRGPTDLKGCTVVSTHEPCPMCAGALIWARVSEIAYGASIEDSMKQGRTMIALGCRENVEKSPWEVRITEGVLKEECSRLYNEEVRKLVDVFRAARSSGWEDARRELLEKRTAWFERNEAALRSELRGTDVDKAYQLILLKIGIDREEAPVVERTDQRITFHSKNFCPALEACEILGLDTSVICKEHTEEATEGLIKKINPLLDFDRNYDRIRPHTPYCEEVITLRQE